ncbi:proline-rich basic protein 1 [Trichechus manatus latirostris]|uniref:Proline-rich basic protein 1 n=1 Tax=Trichechus manatus latirostris TaxID=127582 RepID=A0A2Y9DTW0_TRIMA|nr:proline-rich basic protein 1 [Trichechus manatus latirostris]
MLTVLAPPALPGLPGQLPAAPARRQDSSDSSGSYYTAPGSPGPPDVGPDAEGRASWLMVAPAPGAGAQPRLSVSAQNSRQQHWQVSGFRRGPGSGPQPHQPQLRTLPSGEMEVIFSAGPLFSPSDVTDRKVQQLTARAFRSLSPSEPATPAPDPPQPQAPDSGARWATHLELRPRGPSPTAPTQFECVEVALEERAAPARPRTVPKRQIELRPRPQSPPRAASAQRPPLLLRTGSLDESLGRLQAAAGLVQTALARKLSPAPPALSSATSGPTGRRELVTRETACGARVLLEEARSRPPRVHDGSAPARARRPWPSLRERAIRRDKPTPGTEPLGPVSSSIFLQSEEKIQETHHREPKTQFPRETPAPARNPSFQARAPWAVKPRSPSPPWDAPSEAMRGPRCPPRQALSPWDQAVQRVGSPSVPEASSTRENRNPAVEEIVSRRRSPSSPSISQWNQDVARARSPSLETPSQWEVSHLAIRDTVAGSRSLSLPALPPWETSGRPIEGPWSLSPHETWDPTVQRSSIVSTPEALNGVAQEEQALSTLSTPRTPELTEAQGPSTQEILDLAFRGSQPSPELAASEPPRSLLVSALHADAHPEASGPEEAASGRQCVAIPRPRDVRKMVRTTYAPTFPARTPGSGLPVFLADPHVEEEGTSKSQELEALGSPAPAHYTSIFLKDFLPVVPHPYEPPGPSCSLDTVPQDASKPSGVQRRRAENNTAKPFARTEICLPGALALGHRRKTTPGVQVHGLVKENRNAQARRLVPDGAGRTSPPGGARTSPQRSPIEPAETYLPRPPRPSSPQAHTSSSPGISPKLETPLAAHEPAAAVQPLVPRETQGAGGRTAPAQPRAASAPPMNRPPEGPPQGARRLPGAAHLGRVLVDPESGRYYYVEAPRQPRLRLLFDPESGQYVEVLLPPSPPGPPRRVYTPLALGPSLYPSYGPISGLSLPSSPGLPQLPWASEAVPLDRMYYLPVSGTPSPASPLLPCAPPSSSGPAQQGKDSLFPV